MVQQAIEFFNRVNYQPLMPCIKVIGLGGGGSNAVDRMITVGISGVEFIAANTDHQALFNSEADVRIQLGPQLTRGLGAGGRAEIGREAALESTKELEQALNGADVVFIASGMGGGTGTGAAPIAAKIARDLGALTIAVVTLPFAFEGAHRARTARAGLMELSKQVDTLIEVHNDRLLKIAPRDLKLEVAFRVADEVLRQGIQGIVELVGQTGLINLDFANVEAVIRQGGSALMAVGNGEDICKAARVALHHPLLEHDSIEKATSILVHVSGGPDMALAEVNQAVSQIVQAANPSADVLFGASEEPDMVGKAQVILIATGIQEPGRESIAVHSLFGVPVPADDSESEPQETVAAMDSLDVPAFLRRRQLFGVGAGEEV